MAVKTETARAGEFVQSLGNSNISKEDVTYKSGANVKCGEILAKEVTASTNTSAADAGNTGDGTMGAVTVSADAKPGVHNLVIIEPASNAGAFEVTDPDGEVIGTGTVAVAFSAGGLAFTLADGATDFVAGDRFTITVTQVTEKFIALPNDGSDMADGIAWDDYDASAADLKGVAVVRLAEVNTNTLVWPSGISAANKDLALQELAAKNIIIR